MSDVSKYLDFFSIYLFICDVDIHRFLRYSGVYQAEIA